MYLEAAAVATTIVLTVRYLIVRRTVNKLKHEEELFRAELIYHGKLPPKLMRRYVCIPDCLSITLTLESTKKYHRPLRLCYLDCFAKGGKQDDNSRVRVLPRVDNTTTP